MVQRNVSVIRPLPQTAEKRWPRCGFNSLWHVNQLDFWHVDQLKLIAEPIHFELKSKESNRCERCLQMQFEANAMFVVRCGK
mmetsp:Transcript_25016/g.43768  ORF Transcript_25016/g.43768 Transcript_25016/m.43768 type:complete len:82 (+) Transcript_25016:300-545(+)